MGAMDPGTAVKLVSTIIGFYSNCQGCYKFFADLKNAKNDAQVQAHELGIQESILKAWGHYWELLRVQHLEGMWMSQIRESVERFPILSFNST